MPSAESPVFYDPAGRRWKRVRRIWMVLAIAVTSLAAVLIASVLVNPALPSLSIRPVPSLPHTADLKPKPLAVAANPIQQKAKKAQQICNARLPLLRDWFRQNVERKLRSRRRRQNATTNRCPLTTAVG